MVVDDHTWVTIPPETSTPMDAQLRWVYDKHLGWPGRPEDMPPDTPRYKRPIIWLGLGKVRSDA